MKNSRADFLFGLQLVFATIGCGAQIYQMLAHGISGVNIAMSWGVLLSMVISLVLAHHTHVTAPSRLTYQNRIVYWFWTVGWGMCTLVATFGLAKDPMQWDANEWTTLVIIVAGLLITAGLALHRDGGLSDMHVRVSMALSLRAIPHFFTAAKVVIWGGAGWSPVFLAQGVVSLVLRVTGNYHALRELPADKTRRAGLYIEIGNLIAWATVTVVWVIWFFGSQNATPGG